MNEVKSPKKPLLYYYFVAMLLVMLFNFIAMPWISEHQIKDVDYNTFVTMTEQGEVGRVEIQEQSNRILFTSSDEKTVYKTAMVPDDGLACWTRASPPRVRRSSRHRCSSAFSPGSCPSSSLSRWDSICRAR